jgi:asparagine synthase (glutamine-hydrolysing)
MCGIAGILSVGGRPVEMDELSAMTGAIAHRGPDDHGYYLDGSVGLAMRRLSIIDLTSGRQPVVNEDGSVQIVFNGEIYNFRELRQGLLARGHRFSTTSDTEVIVHLYEELGPRCVDKLRGMFAFALWDTARRQLVIARDRLGIKPLYYAIVDGRLIWGSELKSVLAVPGVDRRLDWAALGHLLTALVTPPTSSIVAGVRKLEPGHILVADAEGGIRIERYWDVRFEPDHAPSEARLAEQLRERLEESVRLHLVSDVPVGAFLSGGMDSSAVVAMMARHVTAPIRTFAIGFSESDFDELAYAREAAKAFGTEHHEMVLGPEALGDLEDIAWYLDEPFGDSSAIPTYMVSKLAAGSVKVVLSGDGGDELFAGYDKYAVEGRERRYRLLPDFARRMIGDLSARMPDGMRGRNYLRHIALPGVDRYLDAVTLFRRDRLLSLLAPDAARLVAREDPWVAERLRLTNGPDHWLSALQYADLHGYLPLDILTKVDRMSMAHSLEARVPLLDHELVEFAATIPPHLLLRNGVRKDLFKRALRGILPDAIISRPKRGFAIPLGRWFRGPLAGFVNDLLLSRPSLERGIFEPREIQRLVERRDRNQEDLDLQLWTLISFELWCRLYLDEATRVGSSRGSFRGDGAYELAEAAG